MRSSSRFRERAGRVVALAALALPTMPAAAGLAELLRDKGVISEAEFRALPASDPGSAALAALLLQKGVLSATEVAALGAPPAPPSVTVATDEGFRFTAADGSRFHTGVLAQLDVGQVDSTSRDLPNRSGVRRFRPAVAGSFRRDWQFRASSELADGGSIIDAYVSYIGLEPVTLTTGVFVQPFGFESVAIDSANQFAERALPFTFVVNRAPGLGVSWAGSPVTLHASVFTEPLVVPDAGDEGYGTALRATYAPFAATGRVLHFGLGLQRRWPTEDNGIAPGRTVRFRAKPETDTSSLRLVDTGEIGGNVRHTTVLNPEFAASLGAWALQAEYYATRVERGAAPTLDFSGWYVQTSVTLTGEPRPYRARNSTFELVRAQHPLGPTGFCALELAMRFSTLDLGDADVDGGRLREATLGLNYFPNRQLRATFNAIRVLTLDGGPFAGTEPTFYQLRLQLAY